MKAVNVVWFVLVVLCLVYLGATCTALPDYVPVRFDTRGYPVRWFSGLYFIGWMLFFLIALNALFGGLFAYARRMDDVHGINIPWKKYWGATTARRAIVARKLGVVSGVAGLFVNIAWLVGYQTVIEKTPSATVEVLGSANLAATFILAGSAVLVIFAILFFKPPRHP